MFDSERLWKHSTAAPPKGLTLELRVNPAAPWEGDAAFRDNNRLPNGVRLSADWADVEAMAHSRYKLFLITRRKGKIVDTVSLPRASFILPINEFDAFLSSARADASRSEVKCPSATDEIIVN